jgi:endonuclease/exonuclease/phosphatase family metal-dependent hydrolase
LTARGARSPDHLRVATLNLLYYPQGDRWRERRPFVEGELRVLAPDVIGFQEVNRAIDQDHALAESAGPDLGFVVHRASETIRSRYPRHWDGVVILARESAGQVLFHKVLRLTHLRIVQALGIRRPDGTTITVANTHLHHPEGDAGRQARHRQANAVLGFLADLPEADVVVLVGDLNAVPGEPALELLFGAGFRSATREAGRGDPETFPSGLVAPTIYRGPGACIDYVLVRGPAVVEDARIAFDRPAPGDPGLFPSDHRGIVVDLALP